MTGSRMRTGIVLLSVGLAAMACRQAPDPPSAEAARRAAAMAADANPDQARLWQDAATQGTAVGMDRVVASNRPVTPRRQPAAAAANPNPPAPQQPPIVIPPRVETQIRILTAPEVGPDGYSGAATVMGASGDRLELFLDNKLGALVMLARAAKAPIPVSLKEQVRLVYIPRRDLRRPEEMLVIRTAAGKGIGRVIQGAAARIEKLTVPLFGVTAVQEPNSSVTLRLGNDQAQGLVPGGTARLGDVFVRVVASYARTGTAAAAAEGPPYLLNLLVWSP